jgi:hypothetical protein
MDKNKPNFFTANFFYGLCLKNTTMTVESKINWAILLSLDIFLPICQFDTLSVLAHARVWHGICYINDESVNRLIE